MIALYRSKEGSTVQNRGIAQIIGNKPGRNKAFAARSIIVEHRQ